LRRSENRGARVVEHRGERGARLGVLAEPLLHDRKVDGVGGDRVCISSVVAMRSASP